MVRLEKIPLSPSVINSLGGPCVVTHDVFMTFRSVFSSLFGITLAACQRVQRSTKWKMMYFSKNKKVTLHLKVELICDVHVALVIKSWLSPLAADLACLHDLWYDLNDTIGHADSLQEAFRHML